MKEQTTSDEVRVPLTLSVTEADRRAFKIMAAEQGTTMSALLHEWLHEHLDRDE